MPLERKHAGAKKGDAFRLDVRGEKELKEKLNAFAKEFGTANAQKTFRLPLKKALKPMRDKIDNETPEDTGEMKKAIKIKISKPKRNLRSDIFDASKLAVYVFVGFDLRRKKGKNAIASKTRLTKTKKKGRKKKEISELYVKVVAHEFGNKKTPAKKMVRKGFDSTKNQVKDIFKKELQKQIEKTAKRLRLKAKKVG